MITKGTTVSGKAFAKALGGLEARAKVFKALAHPTRLFFVNELSRGPRCVCELTDMVGADMSTVSKHLSVLNAAGIVADEKRGQQVFYRLRMTCVAGFIDCVDDFIRQDARQLSSHARLRCGCAKPRKGDSKT
jgi:DNA-binding transcriptional ArsR family regulator